MKIAYTFCGHARTWERCYKNFFDNIYSVLPGDIFIHTWDKVNMPFGSYWNKYDELKKGQLELSQKTPDIKRIYEAYKPKILLVESEREIDAKKLIHPTLYKREYEEYPKFKSHIGVKSILYASRRVFDLANNYGDYDIFFCTRMDINYESKISLEELTSKNLIVARNGYWVSDVWICGPKKYVDIKTNYYNSIDYYWYNNPNFNNFFDIFHEIPLTDYLNDNQVPIEASEISFSIPRMFGEDTIF